MIHLTRQIHGMGAFLTDPKRQAKLKDEKVCERTQPSDKNLRGTKDEAHPLLKEVFSGHSDHRNMELGEAAVGLGMTQWWNTSQHTESPGFHQSYC